VKKKRKKIVIKSLLVFLLVVAFIVLKLYCDAVKFEKYYNEKYGVFSKDDVLKFANAYSSESVYNNIETVQKTIPCEFNETYTSYNEIQKEQGFDLSKYKGQKVELFYCRESEDSESYAVIIVYKNKVIGASIHRDLNTGYIKCLINENKDEI